MAGDTGCNDVGEGATAVWDCQYLLLRNSGRRSYAPMEIRMPVAAGILQDVKRANKINDYTGNSGAKKTMKLLPDGLSISLSAPGAAICTYKYRIMALIDPRRTWRRPTIRHHPQGS